jgi:hypothetical protein
MSYASSAQIQGAIAKFTLGLTTKPSTTQLTPIISEVEGYIESILAAKGIAVPVTLPAYFEQALEGISVAGCAARVLKSMFPDAIGAGETPAYAYWQKLFDDGIKGLVDGSLIPDDPEVIGSASGYVAPSTYFTNNPDEEVELGDIAEPRFKMDKVF